MQNELFNAAQLIYSQNSDRSLTIEAVGDLLYQHLCSGKNKSPASKLIAANIKVFSQATEIINTISYNDLSTWSLAIAYEYLLEAPFDKVDSTTLRKKRRHSGSFYTPQSIVNEMTKSLNISLTDKILDPAMGGGNFLLGVIELLLSIYPHQDVCNWAKNNLFGCDTDRLAIKTARQALSLQLSKHDKLFDPATLQLFNEDALFCDKLSQKHFSIILGNPPYDVLTNFKKNPAHKEYATKIRQSKRFPLSTKGQINLYRVFIERALHLLDDNGQLSFIVPATLMFDKSATTLRNELLTKHQTSSFKYYGEDEKVFASAVQSACIFKAIKNKGQASKITVWNNESSNTLTPKTINNLDGCIPIAPALELEFASWLSDNCPQTFSSIAEISVGEVDQTVFRECMQDDSGSLLLRGIHLSPFKADLQKTPSKERFINKELFLEMKGKTRDEVIKKVSANRIAQLGIRNIHSTPRLIAAIIPENIYCGNSLNMVYAKNEIPLEFLAALLNSRLYDWRFCLTSGNNNINISEVKPLPLPSVLPETQVRKITTLYQKCVDSTPNNLAITRQNMDNAIEQLFNIPDKFTDLLTKRQNKNNG